MPVLKPRSRARGMKPSPALCLSDVCGSVVLVVLSFLPGQLCLHLLLERSQTLRFVWVWPLACGLTRPVRISHLPDCSREREFQARLMRHWEFLLKHGSQRDHLTETSSPGSICLQDCCPEVRGRCGERWPLTFAFLSAAQPCLRALGPVLHLGAQAEAAILPLFLPPAQVRASD